MWTLETLTDVLWNTWAVLGEMAPYLILGFAIAGVMSVVTSQVWVERHLGGRGVWPTVKATLMGIPLPLCSCGVIPVGASLRQQGASRGATSAFLLATPQTGVDSILATYALLGPVFAIVRPLMALVTGIVGGIFIDLAGEKDEVKNESATSLPIAEDSCCKTCHEDNPKSNRFVTALRYGFITLPRDLATHLLIGVVIAGALTVVIEPDAAQAWLGGGLVAMLLMMVIGLPLYVCATGSIPLAVGFMHLGASPGAALVFLIAGPATNAATIAVTSKLLGKRSTMIYLLVAGVAALGAGYFIDFLSGYISLGLPEFAGDAHHHETLGWFTHASAAALLLMLAASYWFTRSSHEGAAPSDDGSQTVIDVKGMTCSHCTGAVSKALSNIQGVTSVDVSLDAGTATVQGDIADRERLVKAVEQLGYHATLRQTRV